LSMSHQISIGGGGGGTGYPLKKTGEFLYLFKYIPVPFFFLHSLIRL
jgi:hypothetical protein